MIATTRTESALGVWTVTHFTPHAADPLADVLERIWLFSGRTALPGERVFPDGSVQIVAQLDGDRDARYRPAGPGPCDPYPPLSISGLRTGTTAIVAPERAVRVLGIQLVPTGAFRLLRTSLHALTERDLDLHDVIGRAAAELGERCAGARDDGACVRAAIAWVASRLERGSDPAAPVVRALRAIVEGGGADAIADLDALSDRSRSRFTAAFRDQVGVAPKRFARLVRFRNALELVQHSPASLGEIALRAGYYDQPHLNAEFRVHAGMTPQQFRRARHFPHSASIAEQIFQDEPAAAM